MIILLLFILTCVIAVGIVRKTGQERDFNDGYDWAHKHHAHLVLVSDHDFNRVMNSLHEITGSWNKNCPFTKGALAFIAEQECIQ